MMVVCGMGMDSGQVVGAGGGFWKGYG